MSNEKGVDSEIENKKYNSLRWHIKICQTIFSYHKILLVFKTVMGLRYNNLVRNHINPMIPKNGYLKVKQYNWVYNLFSVHHFQQYTFILIYGPKIGSLSYVFDLCLGCRRISGGI